MKWLVPLSELAGVTDHSGGVGRRYAAVLPEIGRLGADVTVVLYPDSDIDKNATMPDGIEVVTDTRWRWLPSFIRPVLRALMFRRLVRRTRPDIVLAPEWLGAAAFVPASITVVTNLVTGIGLMNAIEDGAGRVRSVRRALQLRVQDSLERRQVMRSDRVIGCSTAIVAWYQRNASMPAGGSVVRNCIDVERVRQASRDAELPSGWPRGVPVMLHVGRVEVRKGAHTSIEAFNLLSDDFPGLRLVLAGGIGYALPEWGSEGVRSLIKRGVEDRVVFLGNLRDGSIFRAMAEADVCVAPSLWEAFGNVALEVKASGTPLVVTSGSGFDDFCFDGVDSRVVSPNDPQELAAAVADLLMDATQRKRLTDAAAVQVESFAASAVAPDLKDAVEFASGDANIPRGPHA